MERPKLNPYRVKQAPGPARDPIRFPSLWGLRSTPAPVRRACADRERKLAHRTRPADTPFVPRYILRKRRS